MTPETFSARAETLGFAHNALDRLANRRDDAAFLAGLRADPAARVLAVVSDSVVLRLEGATATPWFGFAEAAALAEIEETVFLGLDARGPAFAALLDHRAAADLAARDDLRLAGLRALAVEDAVSAPDLGALAQGKALLHWHSKHRFCANCGAPTHMSGAGWRRECAACGTQHFPRTDPVVIMLATDGERCLLGRQPRFPPRMYSCLAGFLEPGESIEDAVRREIAEEAGVATGWVTYLGSQPWPFPASLMVGCLATATSTGIAIDREELEDARWFSRDEVRAMLGGTHPEGLMSPSPMAIAHHLVRTWVEGDGES